jgi:formate dehydrogenase major subunit
MYDVFSFPGMVMERGMLLGIQSRAAGRLPAAWEEGLGALLWLLVLGMGVACAVRLLEKGHSVVLFEKSHRLGGTPDSIIPETRYDDASQEIDAILAPAKASGRIEIRFGAALGDRVSLDQLRTEFDAVFLGPGLGRASSLGEADGALDALAFLQVVKRGQIQSIGQRVAVLGGGNTAIDAALSAKQFGAKDVYLVYRRSYAEMPAWPNERQRLLEAGVHLLILTAPLGYQTDENGKLLGLRIVRTELGEPDESGRRAPRAVAGTENILPIDTAIEAIGQAIPAELRRALAGLDLTRLGLIATRSNSQATSIPKVFAGGDLVNGGTTAVQGIAEGMHAAEEIDCLLSNSPT